MQAMPGEILQGEYLCCRLKHSSECFRHVQPVRQNSFIYCYFLPWAFPPLGAPRRCARSDAATSFSFFVDFGSLRILPASDAAFLPVVIVFSYFSFRSIMRLSGAAGSEPGGF